MNYFVTAIGTDSGKTLVSAILLEALKADYWKPVQAGEPGDTETVQSLVSNEITNFHPETHRLRLPASPHAAAKYEHKAISLVDFELPQMDNELVIEGAGGVLVPLNEQDYVIDLAKQFQTEVVLVSNLYLGSINHTLLTIEYLKAQQIPVKGIIFNGESNPESEAIILKKSGYKVLLRLPKLSLINKEVVSYWADELILNWYG